VGIQDVDQATAEALGLGTRKGVLIPEVYPGQPADKAGIKRGDVVESVDGRDVTNANELRNHIAAIRPGASVPFKIVRKGKEMTLQVKLAKREEDKIAKLGAKGEGPQGEESADVSKKLGLTVGNLTAEVRERLNLAADVKGVVIVDIEQASQAGRQGLQKDDVVLEINQQAVTSTAEYTKAAKGLKDGSSVLMLVQRGGRTSYVAFKLKK
jgi:serine protease Do